MLRYRSLPEGPRLPVGAMSPGPSACEPGSNWVGADALTAAPKPGQRSVRLPHSEALREEALVLSGRTVRVLLVQQPRQWHWKHDFLKHAVV